MNIRPKLLSLLLVGLALACGDQDGGDEAPAVPTDSEQTFLKGHAVFGHEVRTITPCGDAEPLWAIDSTQLLWDVHRELAPGMEPYE